MYIKQNNGKINTDYNWRKPDEISEARCWFKLNINNTRLQTYFLRMFSHSKQQETKKNPTLFTKTFQQKPNCNYKRKECNPHKPLHLI